MPVFLYGTIKQVSFRFEINKCDSNICRTSVPYKSQDVESYMFDWMTTPMPLFRRGKESHMRMCTSRAHVHPTEIQEAVLNLKVVTPKGLGCSHIHSNFEGLGCSHHTCSNHFEIYLRTACDQDMNH